MLKQYKYQFDPSERLTLVRVDGTVVIDKGKPTSSSQQTDWTFFKQLQTDLMRQEQLIQQEQRNKKNKKNQSRTGGR